MLRTLRDDPELRFCVLADAAPSTMGRGRTTAFEVVYHLYSDPPPGLAAHPRHRRSCRSAIPSITGLWEGAMFHEREMYDMMGIVFEGNRDLRRIYMSPGLPHRSRSAGTSSCPMTRPTRRPPG